MKLRKWFCHNKMPFIARGGEKIVPVVYFTFYRITLFHLQHWSQNVNIKLGQGILLTDDYWFLLFLPFLLVFNLPNRVLCDNIWTISHHFLLSYIKHLSLHKSSDWFTISGYSLWNWHFLNVFNKGTVWLTLLVF